MIGQTGLQPSTGARALSWAHIWILWQTRCWWAALWAPLLQRCDLLSPHSSHLSNSGPKGFLCLHPLQEICWAFMQQSLGGALQCAIQKSWSPGTDCRALMPQAMRSGIRYRRARCCLCDAESRSSPVLHKHKLPCMQGSLPVALAAIIIGRDVLLVTGACVDRCRRVYLFHSAHLRIIPAEAIDAMPHVIA